MHASIRRLSILSWLLSATLLTACAVPQQVEQPAAVAASQPSGGAPASVSPPSAPTIAPSSPAQVELAEGMDLYDKGDFNGAIKKLSGSADIWSADKSLQLAALKTMAFSYCVSSRQTLCRLQFEKALKMDPHFDLEPGEKQHPLWAPVFEQAKKRVAAVAKPAAPTRKPAAKPAATTQ